MTVDKYMVSLKVFLTNTKWETLILQNSNKWHSRGFYDVPGGRIDDDEFDIDYETIIKREISEELWKDVKCNISLKPVSMWRFQCYEDRVFLLMFEADYIAGDIIISDEHESYKWVKLDKINLEEYFMSGMLESVKRYLEYK